jgi:hypothetical protein
MSRPVHSGWRALQGRDRLHLRWAAIWTVIFAIGLLLDREVMAAAALVISNVWMATR